MLQTYTAHLAVLISPSAATELSLGVFCAQLSQGLLDLHHRVGGHCDKPDSAKCASLGEGPSCRKPSLRLASSAVGACCTADHTVTSDVNAVSGPGKASACALHLRRLFLQTRRMELSLDMPLAGQAATAAFCPSPGSTQLLAVGSYELDQATGLRNGTTELLSVLPEPDGACTVEPIASLPSAGVFELIWNCDGPSVLLGSALADGSVRLLLLKQMDEPQLSVGTTASIFTDGALCTNLAFGHASTDAEIAASSSAGDLAVLSQVRHGGLGLQMNCSCTLPCNWSCSLHTIYLLDTAIC